MMRVVRPLRLALLACCFAGPAGAAGPLPSCTADGVLGLTRTGVLQAGTRRYADPEVGAGTLADEARGRGGPVLVRIDIDTRWQVVEGWLAAMTRRGAVTIERCGDGSPGRELAVLAWRPA